MYKKVLIFFNLFVVLCTYSQRQIGNEIVSYNNYHPQFGFTHSISLDGSRLLVTSPYAVNPETGVQSGGAIVYSYNGNEFVPLINSDENASFFYGENMGEVLGYFSKISGDGNTVVLTSPVQSPTSVDKSGYLKIMRYINGSWNEIGKIFSKTLNAFNWFGHSVSISEDGNTILFEENLVSNNSESKYLVYKYDGQNWNQLGDDFDSGYLLTGSNPFMHSSRLSADGNFLTLRFNNSIESYAWNGSSWIQAQSLSVSENVENIFLSPSGSTLIIYHRDSDDNGLRTGGLIVYKFNGNNWEKVAEKNGSGYHDSFGRYLTTDYDGNQFLIYFNDNSTTRKGSVQKFVLDGDTLSEHLPPFKGPVSFDATYWGQSMSSDYNLELTSLSHTGAQGPLHVYNMSDYVGEISELTIFSDEVTNGDITDKESITLKVKSNINLSGIISLDDFNVSGGNISDLNQTSDFEHSFTLNIDKNSSAHVVVGWNQFNNYKSNLFVVSNSNTKKITEFNGVNRGDNTSSSALSSDGKTIVIGSPNSDENGISSGNVKIFSLKNNTVSQIGSTIIGENGETLGHNLSISNDGKTFMVSSIASNSGSGKIRIYELDENEYWIQKGYDFNGEQSC